jgi:hypothetical protein
MASCSRTAAAWRGIIFTISFFNRRIAKAAYFILQQAARSGQFAIISIAIYAYSMRARRYFCLKYGKKHPQTPVFRPLAGVTETCTFALR